MKSCPKCTTNYSETDHNFCPLDGSPLSEYIQPEPEEPSERKDAELNLPVRSYNNIQANPADLTVTNNFFDEPVVAFNLARSYSAAASNQDLLYESTRKSWFVDIFEAKNAKYAFATYHGEIKEVYEISEWHPAPELKNKGRFEFTGQIAPEPIRKKYIGKRIPNAQDRWVVRFFQLLIFHLVKVKPIFYSNKVLCIQITSILVLKIHNKIV